VRDDADEDAFLALAQEVGATEGNDGNASKSDLFATVRHMAASAQPAHRQVRLIREGHPQAVPASTQSERERETRDLCPSVCVLAYRALL
jgi:hypothetical protein